MLTYLLGKHCPNETLHGRAERPAQQAIIGTATIFGKVLIIGFEAFRSDVYAGMIPTSVVDATFCVLQPKHIFYVRKSSFAEFCVC